MTSTQLSAIDDLYIKLAKLIYKYNEENKPIYPAEIALKFKDDKDQKQISKIFMLKIDFYNNDKLEKIINDQVKIIKKAYLDKIILEDTNIENVQKALKNKKIFETLYINI